MNPTPAFGAALDDVRRRKAIAWPSADPPEIDGDDDPPAGDDHHMTGPCRQTAAETPAE